MSIHSTAIIHPSAQIHETAEIGPNVIVEENVTIGKDTKVMANAYLTGRTTIGEANVIHMGAVLGHVPQDHGFKPDTVSYLEVGNRNVIREYSTIHRASKPEGKTIIGNDNFILANVHVGHDVVIGNHVTLATFCGLAGYVTVGDNTFISGGVVIHQFVDIGRYVIISGDSGFSRNIPPFMVAMGRNGLGPINLIGLKRGGFSPEVIREIKEVHHRFFYSDKTQKETLQEFDSYDFQSPEAKELIDFIRNSKRPIAHFAKNRHERADG